MATHASDEPIDLLPAFPFGREPKNPPSEFRAAQLAGGLTPVRMWNGRRAWMATRYEDVRALLMDKRFSANASDPRHPTLSESRAALVQSDNPSLIRYDGAEHARLRKMFLPLFTVKRIEAMRALVEQLTNQLIDEMLAGPKPANFVDAFGLRLPSMVLCQIMGVPAQDAAVFHSCTSRMVDIHQPPEGTIAANAEFAAYVTELIDRKKHEDLSGDDIISFLLREYYVPGLITDKELTANLQILFLAGHETTASTLAHSIIALSEEREQWHKLGTCDDPAFLRSAVEELLRYTSVVLHQTNRFALEDVLFNGQLIRKDEPILCMVNGANRDPSVFADPDRLDLSRSMQSPHVAFGFGAHQCLGQALARLELSIALPALARRMPDLRLANSLDDMVFRGDALTYGVFNVQVTW